jgi:hypothetical protein
MFPLVVTPRFGALHNHSCAHYGQSASSKLSHVVHTLSLVFITYNVISRKVLGVHRTQERWATKHGVKQVETAASHSQSPIVHVLLYCAVANCCDQHYKYSSDDDIDGECYIDDNVLPLRPQLCVTWSITSRITWCMTWRMARTRSPIMLRMTWRTARSHVTHHAIGHVSLLASRHLAWVCLIHVIKTSTGTIPLLFFHAL